MWDLYQQLCNATVKKPLKKCKKTESKTPKISFRWLKYKMSVAGAVLNSAEYDRLLTYFCLSTRQQQKQ